MIRFVLLASILSLTGCRTLTAPGPDSPSRESLSARARPANGSEDPALHIAPVVTRLIVTPEESGIRFSVIFNHRHPGDHPTYDPFTSGGFAFVVDIDPLPPYDVSTWDVRRLWVLPAEDGLELLQTSLHGSEARGSIPIDVRPRRIEFMVPFSALRDDDGQVRYRLHVLAVTSIGQAGPVRVLTDTYPGNTMPGI